MEVCQVHTHGETISEVRNEAQKLFFWRYELDERSHIVRDITAFAQYIMRLCVYSNITLKIKRNAKIELVKKNSKPVQEN